MTDNKKFISIIISISLITAIFFSLIVPIVVFAEGPPLAVNDSYTTPEDSTLSITAPGVLFNDNDPDGNPLTAIKVTDPIHGTIFLGPSGFFIYSPTTNYIGIDSFTYKLNDGTAESNVATVSITVTPVNHAPSFINGTDQTVPENSGPQTITNWATDISVGAPEESGQTLNFVINNNSNPNLFSVAPAISPTGTLTYAPTPNAYGSAIIDFSLHDNGGTDNGGVDTSPSQTFTITVTEVANTPPVANRDNYTTNENTILNTAAPGVLANDTDADRNSLTAIKVTDPTYGTLILNADGSFTYTPTINYIGTDSFTYMANDGTADSNIVTASITVNIKTTTTLNPGTTDVSSSIDKSGNFTQKIQAISDDNKATIVIEPGTTGKTAAGLPLSEITLNETNAPQNLTTGVNIVSSSYEFGPSGATFNPPVTIRINYDPGKIPAGVDETDLVVGYYDNETKTWQKLVSTVDSGTHSVSAQVGHLTLFAVISEINPTATSTTPTPAMPINQPPNDLLIDKLKITPSEILVGKAINIDFVATNTGVTAGSYPVTLSIDGVPIDSKTIYLDAGQKQSLTFITSQNKVGRHTLSINDLTSTFTVKSGSPIAITGIMKLPLPVLDISFLAIGLMAIILFIKRKRGNALKVQTENSIGAITLNTNTITNIEKNLASTVSVGDNNIEKTVLGPKTPSLKITPTSAEPKIVNEEDQKLEVATPDFNETMKTDDRHTVESNIFRELEHNLIIATTPLGEKLISFDTTCWDNIRLKTDRMMLVQGKKIAMIYADIDLANTVVMLANRFPQRSEAVTQSYLKLCAKVAAQISVLIHPEKFE